MHPPPGNGVVLRLLMGVSVIAASFYQVVGFNITAFLSPFPELSSFNRLLSETGVAGDLAQRSSLTILAVPNGILDSAILSSRIGNQIPDSLRYHVLLQYLDWPALRGAPAAGKLVTTLFQTTGRAEANLGAVNLTRDLLTGNVTVCSPGPSNVTVVSLVRDQPYVAVVLAVDGLLLPSGFDLSASETGPPPVPVNISRVLIDAKDFNVVGSMLAASGVTVDFEADERGAGITAFLPTDDAFASPAARRIQSLPADTKAVILKYHALHSYYPLGSLQSIVNPVQPTLATEERGAGSFTLNITRETAPSQSVQESPSQLSRRRSLTRIRWRSLGFRSCFSRERYSRGPISSTRARRNKVSRQKIHRFHSFSLPIHLNLEFPLLRRLHLRRGAVLSGLAVEEASFPSPGFWGF